VKKPAIFLLAALIVSCGTDRDHGDKMIFRYNESAGITSLDPAYSRNLENIWACNMLYNGLVEIDDSLRVIPSIASHWEVDSSGTRYRFYLRDDVHFHDSEVFPERKGRKVVAADFVYSFQRLINPKMASPGSWVFGMVAKTDPFKSIGDSIVEIKLEKPFPPFLSLLGMEYCSVVPREAIEKYGDDFRSKPVGTGPFKINFWIENTRLVLLKNEHYFERDAEQQPLPYLDAVSISFIPDKSAAFLDLLKGNFDFMSGLHPSYKDELLMPTGALNELYADKLYLQRHPFLKTDYLGFVVSSETNSATPWHNRDLRRAVSYAINREAMVRYMRNNVYTPASGGFIPEGMPGYSSKAGYSYNPDSVRSILTRCGYPGGAGLPVLTLSTTSDYVDICEFVQHQLSEFGISMKVDVLPASVHRELSARGDLEFFRKSWLADYPDDENFMALFYGPNRTPAGPNYSLYANHRFDKLYEEAISTTEPALRQDMYRMMDSIAMADAPVVALYYDVVMRFVAHGVTGLDASPMNVLDLKKVRIEK
jgi:peptide/nickel transport system substrate-binding protein